MQIWLPQHLAQVSHIVCSIPPLSQHLLSVLPLVLPFYPLPVLNVPFLGFRRAKNWQNIFFCGHEWSQPMETLCSGGLASGLKEGSTAQANLDLLDVLCLARLTHLASLAAMVTWNSG